MHAHEAVAKAARLFDKAELAVDDNGNERAYGLLAIGQAWVALAEELDDRAPRLSATHQ